MNQPIPDTQGDPIKQAKVTEVVINPLPKNGLPATPAAMDIREQIVQARYGKFDTYAQLNPDEQETIDRIVKLFTEAMETELRAVRDFKPKMLPKSSTNIEATKQGINFFHRQLYKFVDQRLAELVGTQTYDIAQHYMDKAANQVGRWKDNQIIPTKEGESNE